MELDYRNYKSYKVPVLLHESSESLKIAGYTPTGLLIANKCVNLTSVDIGFYYYYQVLHKNSIYSYMFRLTIGAIIRESFSAAYITSLNGKPFNDML